LPGSHKCGRIDWNPQPLKFTPPRYNWNIVESGVKHHNSLKIQISWCLIKCLNISPGHKCGRIDHFPVAGQHQCDVDRVNQIMVRHPLKHVEMDAGEIFKHLIRHQLIWILRELWCLTPLHGPPVSNMITVYDDIRVVNSNMTGATSEAETAYLVLSVLELLTSVYLFWYLQTFLTLQWWKTPGARVAQWVRSLDLTTHTSLSPRRRGFAPSFVNYKKGRTWLAVASDKACPVSMVLCSLQYFNAEPINFVYIPLNLVTL
jgi:hypothetical protein